MNMTQAANISMPSDTVRRLRDRKAREDSLLAAAARLFASRGYEATTTREIAAKAGCAEGLISRYFKGKAGLLHALIGAHVVSRHTSRDVPMPMTRDFEEEIVRLIAAEVEQTWQDREFYKAIIPPALQEGEAAPNLSQAALAMGNERVVRQLHQSRHCRDLSDQQRASLARFINVNGFIFGFWYPVALGQDRDMARQSALAMASLMAERIRCVRSSKDSVRLNILDSRPKPASSRASAKPSSSPAEFVI